MKILLAEDDPYLSSRLRDELARQGYVVDVASDGEEAETLGNTGDYDAVILDLGLPRRSGLEVLRNWRARGNRMPVLVLTVRNSWQERVDGLRAGADDYLGKPFHMEELLERLRALIRRAHGLQSGNKLRAGGLQLDESRREIVLADGTRHPLSAVEFRLLRYFMHNIGQVLSKRQLAEHIYDEEEEPDSNALEAHIYRLRRKVGKDHIKTLRGQGYMFVPEEKGP